MLVNIFMFFSEFVSADWGAIIFSGLIKWKIWFTKMSYVGKLYIWGVFVHFNKIFFFCFLILLKRFFGPVLSKNSGILRRPGPRGGGWSESVLVDVRLPPAWRGVGLAQGFCLTEGYDFVVGECLGMSAHMCGSHWCALTGPRPMGWSKMGCKGCSWASFQELMASAGLGNETWERLVSTVGNDLQLGSVAPFFSLHIYNRFRSKNIFLKRRFLILNGGGRGKNFGY